MQKHSYILSPIVLLTLLFPSFAYGVTMDDLVKRDGLYHKKFTDVPFTGKTTGFVKGTFKNGKKNGTWVIYYDNGQLLTKSTYKDGKLDGPVVQYSPNGKVVSTGTFKDGRMDGGWQYYNEDGSKDLDLSGTYKNGKKISD